MKINLLILSRVDSHFHRGSRCRRVVDDYRTASARSFKVFHPCAKRIVKDCTPAFFSNFSEHEVRASYGTVRMRVVMATLDSHARMRKWSVQ